MAAVKPKTASRKSTPHASPAGRARSGQTLDLQKRAARDVTTPATRRIERSLDEGRIESLQSFRTSINWS
jgi:hypothetical protein